MPSLEKINVRATLVAPVFIAISIISFIAPFFLMMVVPYIVSYIVTIIYYYIVHKPADVYIPEHPFKFALSYNVIALILCPIIFYITLEISSTVALAQKYFQ